MDGVRERPILFSAPMVRAILDVTKTQTRRGAYKLVRHPDFGYKLTPSVLVHEKEPQHVIDRCCPYGQPGDRLWVREAWMHVEHDVQPVRYRATNPSYAGRWRPSIHMPRWASRINLEITGIRVERLQDISETDAMAEGIQPELDGWTDYSNPSCQMCLNPVDSYRTLWESINGAGSWALNPWVWCISFRRVD